MAPGTSVHKMQWELHINLNIRNKHTHTHKHSDTQAALSKTVNTVQIYKKDRVYTTFWEPQPQVYGFYESTDY